ncbi:MAG: (Fe-S)-binding protein [Deltaproteobacteria bacterium]|nr:(Fe-S)-binding protein [Deltaproteobacteria bacterium]
MIPERVLFWEIGLVWLFYVAVAVAVCLLLVGVSAHIKVWWKSGRKGKIPLSQQALRQTLLDTFLGLRVLKGDLPAGIMHALLFWGFVILTVGTGLLMVHEWLFEFLAGRSHLLFEVSMEVGGLILLAGILWALIRRYLQRVPRLEHRLEDALVPVWLLLVVVSGFLLEGVRLGAQQPPWADWSFAGSWIAGWITNRTAESAYPYLWWGHALLSLGFLAIIPYTKLFHILGAPVTYYFHHSSDGPREVALSYEEPGNGVNIEDAVFFDACMRCGRCVEKCPSTGAGEPYSPRDFVQASRRAMWKEQSHVGDIRFLTEDPAIDDKAAWYCTTCSACLEACPVYGATFKYVTEKRTGLIEEGKGVPDLMNQTLERLFNYDNPWVSSKKERAAWAKDLNIPPMKRGGKEAQLCYFVGCTTSFDARAQDIARSLSNILTRAGVNYGILADKEPCCGDIARVVGEVGLFLEQMEKSREVFEKYGIEEVVTSSPHCFHTFLNEYPDKDFRARHYTLLLRDLIAGGKIRFSKPVNATVTYHDPCYLGRHNRIFEEPREIIRSIPGITLREMRNHGPDSLCCGGGGGRMWQGPELRGDERMGEIRIKEARETGAQIVITACPLCLIMLEDALKTVGLEKDLRVMDLNELVLHALE